MSYPQGPFCFVPSTTLPPADLEGIQAAKEIVRDQARAYVWIRKKIDRDGFIGATKNYQQPNFNVRSNTERIR